MFYHSKIFIILSVIRFYYVRQIKYKNFLKQKYQMFFFLMDVAHFKVTCKTLKIDLITSYKKNIKIY